MKAIKYLMIGATVALSGCFPPVERKPLPGDPVKACRSGIREACALLAMQQNAMRDLHQQAVTAPVYRPVYASGYPPGARASTTCQTNLGITQFDTRHR
ncbi:hypothetical protein [Pseudogemmobacter bohemicus]|uniref:hypothetical protein n=1 Tax=Pseudogemmobacter bohemicus TaxID=2250708 RepID=UPI000DD3C24A|nr:hypothetical protein [Pseudogemmobacter bohemicus]